MMTIRQLAIALATALLCAGCGSTSIRSAWFDTDFTGPPMRRVVVVGELGSTTENLALEDGFVDKLRAAGVDAIAGRTLRVDGPGGSDAFAAAVTGSGAQGLILVRLLGVDTRTQVSTTMAPGGMGWGRSPWGGPWGGPGIQQVPVTRVTQYDLAAVETKVFDVKTRQLVWAATTSTINPRSVAQELPSFADVIIGQLRSRDIIAPK